mmetsp:Transcript_12259/g.40261  ORF Transcript_12259/g.40261 Transcript_12259/m.40261 type:complete len:257 (+) Transcript_12259:597-1367(+)|eukprot:scaffold5504_cov101-Isochrysis_galbana.AAC.3
MLRAHVGSQADGVHKRKDAALWRGGPIAAQAELELQPILEAGCAGGQAGSIPRRDRPQHVPVGGRAERLQPKVGFAVVVPVVRQDREQEGRLVPSRDAVRDQDVRDFGGGQQQIERDAAAHPRLGVIQQFSVGQPQLAPLFVDALAATQHQQPDGRGRRGRRQRELDQHTRVGLADRQQPLRVAPPRLQRRRPPRRLVSPPRAHREASPPVVGHTHQVQVGEVGAKVGKLDPEGAVGRVAVVEQLPQTRRPCRVSI